MRGLLATFSLMATAACSSSSPAAAVAHGDGGAPGDGSTPPGSFTVTFGPIQVDAGSENTQCIVVRVGNTTALHLGRIHDLLGNSSHHMIVYKVNDTTERPVPFDCHPFTDALDPAKGNPIMISQKKDDWLNLPPGVALTLDPHQMLRVEMHYINPTNSAVTLESTSTMIPIADGQFQEASFLFIGDPQIAIPAQSSFTLGPVFFQVPSTYASSNFFAITGHEQHWGTNVRVSTAASADDPGTAVYDVPGWSWSEPKTVTFDSPFHVPAGGGFKFQCDWFNGSMSPVNFGESANDEMCFFWAYYYPSQGAKVCFHIRGVDECCPGTSPICAALAAQGSDAGTQDASSD